jgi:FkbM family methyltransferase
MKGLFRKFAARLPKRWQQELKRRYFRSQIRRHCFRTVEREYDLMPELIAPGDWVLDLGANIGHYTVRCAEIVGSSGRVIAFEPVSATFELLAANAALVPARNITVINAAVSDTTGVIGMQIPQFASGLDNFYEAQITTASAAAFQVLALTVDSLSLPHPVRLVKIDTEAHEMSVLKGMVNLLNRDKPLLMIEENTPEVRAFLEAMGYRSVKIKGSSNRIFSHGQPFAVKGSYPFSMQA